MKEFRQGWLWIGVEEKGEKNYLLYDIAIKTDKISIEELKKEAQKKHEEFPELKNHRIFLVNDYNGLSQLICAYFFSPNHPIDMKKWNKYERLELNDISN